MEDGYNFEWDTAKESRNIEKHAIDFSFASRIFFGDLIEITDTRKDYGETRIIAIGKVSNVYITVVYTKRKNSIRLISARKSHAKEKQKYQEILEQKASTKLH